ncbi:MAG: hypothetical protein PUE66_04320 [Erysipelotrichaceae bacterium]|nr:hypothetical protein [Erysipelotrichaceae bacterium]
MKIEVKNFNCIKQLKYEIEDNKINYLIGNSGSGKSSIAQAISSRDYDLHTPYYNSSLKPEVKVNGMVPFEKKCYVFDDEYMRNILISKESADEIYSILIDDEKNLSLIRSDYQKSISALEPVKDKLFEIKRNIDVLVKDLQISYLANGTSYKSTCAIQKMVKNVEENNASYVKYKKYDSKRIKWYSDGTKYEEYENGKCPFCNRKLSENRKSIIDKILIFDAKTYEKINLKNNIFNALKMKQPDWVKKKEVSEFNKKIREHIQIKDEIDEAIQYINGIVNADLVFSNKIEKLKISSTLKKLYPEIADAFSDFNLQYSVIRKSLGKVKSESEKLINKNVKGINNQLEHLGIDYKFKKTTIYEEDKKADYIIVHKNDENPNEDKVKGLSYGEKNLIGLVLFLCAHGKDELVIIDDPASSFDEYRRKVLFDMFYEFKGNNTTMLVISHDPLFAKFALIHDDENEQNKYTKNNGSISLLESYDIETIKPINRDDFDSLTEFIKRRINELNPSEMTYQLAANMRLFYEREKSKKYHKEIYGYLSMIIHKKAKSEIDEQLAKAGRSEEDLLKVISDTFGFEQTLCKLRDSYVKNINYRNMNNVEKIVFAREMCSGSGSKRIKDELSNIIHLNNSYLICLNPYKFNYYSKFVDEYIKNQIV